MKIKLRLIVLFTFLICCPSFVQAAPIHVPRMIDVPSAEQIISEVRTRLSNLDAQNATSTHNLDLLAEIAVAVIQLGDQAFDHSVFPSDLQMESRSRFDPGFGGKLSHMLSNLITHMVRTVSAVGRDAVMRPLPFVGDPGQRLARSTLSDIFKEIQLSVRSSKVTPETWKSFFAELTKFQGSQDYFHNRSALVGYWTFLIVFGGPILQPIDISIFFTGFDSTTYGPLFSFLSYSLVTAYWSINNLYNSTFFQSRSLRNAFGLKDALGKTICIENTTQSPRSRFY